MASRRAASWHAFEVRRSAPAPLGALLPRSARDSFDGAARALQGRKPANGPAEHWLAPAERPVARGGLRPRRAKGPRPAVLDCGRLETNRPRLGDRLRALSAARNALPCAHVRRRRATEPALFDQPVRPIRQYSGFGRRRRHRSEGPHFEDAPFDRLVRPIRRYSEFGRRRRRRSDGPHFNDAHFRLGQCRRANRAGQYGCCHERATCDLAEQNAASTHRIPASSPSDANQP